MSLGTLPRNKDNNKSMWILLKFGYQFVYYLKSKIITFFAFLKT